VEKNHKREALAPLETSYVMETSQESQEITQIGDKYEVSLHFAVS
jgi:hypothetical protein